MMKPTQRYVRSLKVKGWADYKHKLAAAGVIAAASDDVPAEWQVVFLKVFRK